MIAPDDSPGAIFGDLVPTLTTAGITAGTLRLSVGLYRLTAEEHGYIDNFTFKNVGDAEDSCSVYPIMGNGPVDGLGPFPLCSGTRASCNAPATVLVARVQRGRMGEKLWTVQRTQSGSKSSFIPSTGSV